ncbi:MAG: hypothetical protein EXS49_01965 [Candidatus Pacebacteria bacterium]|nr:hypothetical protein [Candidatus Paceibacterota bacterium]
MKKKLFKIVSIFSLVSIVLMSFFPGGNIKEVFKTERADAQLTTIDFANLGTALYHVMEFIATTLKDAAEAEIKKQILDQLVNQIIQWIQGGGKPKFVSDFGGFLEEAGQNAVGQFAHDLGLEFLCSPFNLQLRFALFPVASFGGGSGRFSCTLDQIVGNIENFQNDFRDGGWILFDRSYEPQNNFYTLLIMANIEKNSRIAQATSKALNAVNQASGYLSTEDCEEDPSSNAPDQDGDGKKGDIASRCVVTTPGKHLGELTSKAIGSDIDFIINADGVGAYVAAIVDAAINSLIISGAEGLLGAKNGHQGQNVRVDPCFGLTGPPFDACKDYQDVKKSQMDLHIIGIKAQVEDQLDDREDAKAEIDSFITKVNNYEVDLNALVAQFNPLSCPNKTTSLNEINVELAYSTSSKQTKLNEGLENDNIILKFEDALTGMNEILSRETASSTDDIVLARILGDVQSHIINPQEAPDFLGKMKSDTSALEDRIDDKLDRFNKLLRNCQAGI